MAQTTVAAEKNDTPRWEGGKAARLHTASRASVFEIRGKMSRRQFGHEVHLISLKKVASGQLKEQTLHKSKKNKMQQQ